ncbi:cysteine hydrolase family protein, partial [Enterococcus casseliflavus]
MKKALVIIDVQNDYFKEGRMALHSPEQALANINKLEASFIEKQLPIIYIQHINDQEAADFGMATVFLTNFIRCRTSFRMLFRLSLTMSLLGCDDLRQELTV